MHTPLLRKSPRFLCLLLVAGLIAYAGSVRSEPSRVAQPIEAVPVPPGETIPIDGTLNHPAWQRAPVYSAFVEREPVNGAEPKYETRVQVLVDKSAVIVGVTAIDPDPSLVREELVRHDLVRRTQDFVALYLDPVGRRSAAQWFRVGAGGSTTDGMHTAEDDSEDISPDFDWDAAVARHERGYSVVFRIPFASLRYSGSENGPWRILVLRRVPRSEVYQLTSTFIPAESPSIVSAMQPLRGVTIPADDSFFTIRPNLTMRKDRERSAAGPASDRSEFDVGLDLKWRPTSWLVTDATINPDFSQVELDVPTLSRNTTFAIFRKEKRPFFLESSDLLRSPVNALWTRSVTRPAWGLRGTFRTDNFSGTTFVARDKGAGVVLLPNPYGTGFADQPASYVGVARGRYDKDAVSLGGLASLRSFNGDVGSNAVAGPDATWQATDNLRIRGQWLLSNTTAIPDENGVLRRSDALSGHYGYLNAFWRTDGYELNASIDDVSHGFRDDNGFVSQTGIAKYGAYFNRVLRNLGPLNELTLSLAGEIVKDKRNQDVVSSTVIPNLYAAYGSSEAIVEYRGWSRVRLYEGGPLLQERYWHLSYSRGVSTWMPHVSVTYDTGELADVQADMVRDGSRISLLARFRPLKRFEFDIDASRATLNGSRDRVFSEKAIQFLGVWHVAARQSLRLIFQRTSLDRLAEPSLGIAAATDKTRADSLTYAWRRSAGTTLHVGATRTRGGLGLSDESTEAYIKLQLDTSELRSF